MKTKRVCILEKMHMIVMIKNIVSYIISIQKYLIYLIGIYTRLK